MKFAAYMAVLFITVFHILLVLFCITVYMVVCFVCFCLILYIMYFYCYEFLLLCLCILIVMYVPFCVFCFIVLFCVLFVCKCVLYYCRQVSTQLQLTCISYHIPYLKSYHIKWILRGGLLRAFVHVKGDPQNVKILCGQTYMEAKET